MAQAKLNFNEEAISSQELLYNLYSKLYEGMRVAQTVEAPPVDDNIPIDEAGNPDERAMAEVQKKMEEYSTILMKNSAYLYANSILSVITSGGGSGGEGGGLGYVSRTGDNMEGNLAALYGFQAGDNGVAIFNAYQNKDGVSFANVEGNIIVTNDATVKGKLNLANTGIWVGENQIAYIDKGVLNIANPDMKLTGAISIDGSLQFGENGIVINDSGITWGEYEFYHTGNANNANVDWTMNNANIHGTLQAYQNAIINGRLVTIGGFTLGANEQDLIYSSVDEYLDENGEVAHTAYVTLNSDLHIRNGYGLKLGDDYIVQVRDGDNGVVSFSAPNRVLNLGDSDGEKQTQYIALQTAIKNYHGDYNIVSQYGDGNFPNSFSAGTGNSGATALQTYYKSTEDQGVVSFKRLRFGSANGPRLESGEDSTLSLTIPWIRSAEGSETQTDVATAFYFDETTSLFKDLSKEWSSTLHIFTEADFVCFDKSVESESFSIKSEQYKTRLIENALFLNDGAFIEGLVDGIRYAGNAYFDGNITSPRFASGFAGYGFGIVQDKATGNYAETLDEITIRKKFRAYEFEVQKISATNGSLWVSDSCSGDEVREIV